MPELITPPTAQPATTQSAEGAATPQKPETPPQPPKTEAPPKEKKAPEHYEFKTPKDLPEGHQLDTQVLEVYEGVARELGLPQDAAQSLLDKVMPVLFRRGVEQQEAVRSQWIEQAKNDKEFGGAKLAENLAVARKALDTYGTPALRELLNSALGLGDHPEVIRFFYKIGRTLSEDRHIVTGKPGSSVDPNDEAAMAQKLYPKSASSS